jgi:hypothetical protein
MGTVSFYTKYIAAASFKFFLIVGGIQKDSTMLLYYHVIADRRHRDTLFMRFKP